MSDLSEAGVRPPEYWVGRWRDDQAEYKTDEAFLEKVHAEIRAIQEEAYEAGRRKGALESRVPGVD